MLRALFLAPWLLCSCMAQESASRTAAQKRVVQEMSNVRLHPRDFARWLRTQVGYFEGTVWKLPEHVPIQTQEGAAALNELIAFLEQVPLNVGPLRWNEGLSGAARQFVQEQGPTGQTGHKGPTGSTVQSRALQHGLFQSMLGEVISYGQEEPRWTIVQLLVDDGIPDRGHRNAVFNPAFHTAGAAIGPHAVYGEMTVIDLADAFVANP